MDECAERPLNLLWWMFALGISFRSLTLPSKDTVRAGFYLTPFDDEPILSVGEANVRKLEKRKQELIILEREKRTKKWRKRRRVLNEREGKGKRGGKW